MTTDLTTTDLDLNITSNHTASDEIPQYLKQPVLIFRLVVFGIGVFSNFLLIFIYIKCSSIITSRIGVYFIHTVIATLFVLIDIVFWSLKEFGFDHNDYLPSALLPLPQIMQIGVPTASLFFTLMAFDRVFATCCVRCYRSCFGSRINAYILSIFVWLISIFFIVVIVFPDVLLPHDQLYYMLRFIISYLAPLVLKLLLVIILIVKRKTVPDNDQSQTFINRQRRELYFVVTVLIIHLLFSLPWYIFETDLIFIEVDNVLKQNAGIGRLCYFISEVPLVLAPLLAFIIHPEFKDSLVSVCTCSGSSHRAALAQRHRHCDEHESQPLAPLATSPLGEEKADIPEEGES